MWAPGNSIPVTFKRKPTRAQRAARAARAAARAVLAPPPATRDTTLARMERMGALTYLVSSAEYLARPGDRRRGGFNDWDVARRTLLARAPRATRIVDVIARREVTAAIHVARIAAAAALIAPTRGRRRGLAGAVLASSSVGLHNRHHYGTDGTDQVSFIVAASTAVARAVQPSSRLVDAVLWSVALQGTMSYAMSGWVKLAGPSWRSGVALPGVTRTRTYGDPQMWRLLTRRPRVARVLGLSVLAMECLFPSVYLAHGRIAPAWLHGTASFHLVNARVMGLGRFVWAFSGLHPAVLYATDSRQRRRSGRGEEPPRDDSVPHATALLGAAAFAAGLVAQARRRTRVLAGAEGEERLTTSAGNELGYVRHGRSDAGCPLLILDHGLLSSPDFWDWTARGLADRCEVVTYARAGYASSRYADRRPGWTVGAAVDDLIELARHLGGERRPLLLAGHSLGGWIALRAAAQAPALVDGVALVDSSHPAELQRSSRQAKGQEAITQNLLLMGPSLSLGLGSLLESPEWIGHFPPDLRKPILDQYRDPRMWTAGLREWRAVATEFEAFSEGDLPAIECPVVSITAGLTSALDPIQEELHRELATLNDRSRHVVVPGVDHERLLFQEKAANAVAGHIGDLVEQVTTRTEAERGAPAQSTS